MNKINHNIFKYICYNLTACDLFAISCVNKKFNKWTKRYFVIHNCNKLCSNTQRVIAGCTKLELPCEDITNLFLIAAANGKLFMCKFIFNISNKLNLNLDINNEFGNVIFASAAANGKLDVCKWLYKTISINVHYNYEYALRLAAANGHLLVFKWLLRFKPNLRVFNNKISKIVFKRRYYNLCKLIIKTDPGAF